MIVKQYVPEIMKAIVALPADQVHLNLEFWSVLSMQSASFLAQ